MKMSVNKLALAASLVLATLFTAEAASAQTHRRHHVAPRAYEDVAPAYDGNGWDSRDVALPRGESGGSADWFNIDRGDHASSPYAGGGGL